MSSFAIIETGSKQYRVEPKQVIEVELLELPEKKKEVALEKVLLVGDGKGVHVGTPFLKGAKVICHHLGEIRGRKVIVFKFKKRKSTKKKRGHRQDLTRLMVKEIKLS